MSRFAVFTYSRALCILFMPCCILRKMHYNIRYRLILRGYDVGLNSCRNRFRDFTAGEETASSA